MTSVGASPQQTPGQMSFTRVVPPGVPSVLHSSAPLTGSIAIKTAKVPSDAAPAPANDDAIPGVMSDTSAVPATVPSVFQSSDPCTPSLASKKRSPFAAPERANVTRFALVRLISRSRRSLVPAGAGLTACTSGAEVEGRFPVSPAYCAVIELVPRASAEIVTAALPAMRLPRPTALAPLKKVTAPVGADPVTMAVKVTTSAVNEGFAEEVRTVVVAVSANALEAKPRPMPTNAARNRQQSV